VSLGSFHFLPVSIKELGSKEEKEAVRKIIQETRLGSASEVWEPMQSQRTLFRRVPALGKTTFILKNKQKTNYGYSELDIWQIFS